MKKDDVHIEVKDLTIGYDEIVIMRNLNFVVKRKEIFVVMGGSGCGKSTLLKNMVGLLKPIQGTIYYDGKSFFDMNADERGMMLKRFGVSFQGGALWSSMTLLENVALMLEEYTDLSDREIRDVAAYKLALVGLKGYEAFYPSAISGGMRKRAALARAMALDPEILFFDEPSAGLDPVSSKRLDDLILELRESLGTTIVVVTHELPSIFAIADNAIFLDDSKKGIGAIGNPNNLIKQSSDPRLLNFLKREACY